MAHPGTSVPFRNADFGRFRKVGWITQKFKSTFSLVNMSSFLTKIVPLESSRSQLSNGTKIIKNGYILRTLWTNPNNRVCNQFFRFRNWVPSWTAKNSYTGHPTPQKNDICVFGFGFLFVCFFRFGKEKKL